MDSALQRHPHVWLVKSRPALHALVNGPGVKLSLVTGEGTVEPAKPLDRLRWLCLIG
jgi:hypothetical protein